MLMEPSRQRSDRGVALIEAMVALVVLAIAILGVAGSTSGMSLRASTAEVHAGALQAVDDQLARISLDPRLGRIDSLYAGTDSLLVGLPGFRRITTIDTVEVDLGDDRSATYRWVTVTVRGPELPVGISRSVVLGAP